MPAYVIVEVEVHDPVRYEDYKRMAAAAAAAHGGRFIVRGGVTESVEGGWAPSRLVILQFDSLEAARAWYASPEYAEALALRHATASSKMVMAEGVPAPVAKHPRGVAQQHPGGVA